MKANPRAVAALLVFVVAHLVAKVHQKMHHEVQGGLMARFAGLRGANVPLRWEALKTIRLTAPEGDVRSLEALVQEQETTIVAFFEVWCGPCRVELPQLQTLLHTFEKQGVAVVAVHTDGTAEEVARFTKALGLGFPVLRDEDKSSKAAGIDAVPTLVVFSQNGTILRQHRGADDGLQQFIAQRVAQARRSAR